MDFTRLSARRTGYILQSRADPLDVLKTTARVTARMSHVSISLRRIEIIAHVLSLRHFEVPAWNYKYHFFDGTERSLTYLFLLDALNFSFWGTPRWQVRYSGEVLNGYWALAASLKRASEQETLLLDAQFLASIHPDQLARVLRGRGVIPLLVDRWRNVRELGQVLSERFGGSAARVVEEAGHDAARLARSIAENFTSFHDKTIYGSHAVNFFKRAQILVADIAGAFGGKGWGEFSNLETLTAFADYKLPQILRAWGILKYDAGLARRVDAEKELAKDSPEEIEIRSATLWAVELLRIELANRGQVLTSPQVDWFLWESSHGDVEGLKPYHRVRTIYY